MSDLQWWINWLDKRFGHADYLQMSREIKLRYFEQCARELMIAEDIGKEKNAALRKAGEALANLALRLLWGGSTDNEELEKLTDEWKDAYDE